MQSNFKFLAGIAVGLSLLLMSSTCDGSPGGTPQSSSGVAKAQIRLKPNMTFEGQQVTAEQFNILTRQSRGNKPGSTKHVYIISAFSGDVIIYSTVRGKVTSSGKRLNPYSVVATDGQYVDSSSRGVPITVGNRDHFTPEILQDDGTYGSSNKYLYWVDARGNGHEHYISGGQIVHVSDVPMAFPKIILNLETASVPAEGK